MDIYDSTPCGLHGMIPKQLRSRLHWKTVIHSAAEYVPSRIINVSYTTPTTKLIGELR